MTAQDGTGRHISPTYPIFNTCPTLEKCAVVRRCAVIWRAQNLTLTRAGSSPANMLLTLACPKCQHCGPIVAKAAARIVICCCCGDRSWTPGTRTIKPRSVPVGTERDRAVAPSLDSVSTDTDLPAADRSKRLDRDVAPQPTTFDTMSNEDAWAAYEHPSRRVTPATKGEMKQRRRGSRKHRATKGGKWLLRPRVMA
jgi:hypothetical protein